MTSDLFLYTLFVYRFGGSFFLFSRYLLALA